MHLGDRVSPSGGCAPDRKYRRGYSPRSEYFLQKNGTEVTLGEFILAYPLERVWGFEPRNLSASQIALPTVVSPHYQQIAGRPILWVDLPNPQRLSPFPYHPQIRRVQRSVGF